MPTGHNIIWNDDWIRENYNSYPSFTVLKDIYNELFGENVTLSAMKNHTRIQLGLSKERQRGRRFTEEQLQWLKENYPILGCKEAVRQFNAKFNENRTISSMKNFGTLYNIQVYGSVATQNKLKYGARREGSKRALRSIGDVRFESGRYVIKTEDGWQMKCRYIWEKEHGKLPKGYIVLHLDGDEQNDELSNLAAVPLKYLGMLQGNNLRSDIPEVTKTAILWCQLYEALGMTKRDLEKETL